MTATVDPALAERLAKMSPAKRALFLKASGFSPETAQEILATQDGAGIPRRDPAAPVPMSFAQELLWRLERASPGYIYNVPKATRFAGPLDVGALERALNTLVARHEVFRTTFDLIDGEPRQVVHQNVTIPLDVVDLTSMPANAREEEARHLVRDRSRRPFDLAKDMQLRATLVRIADDDHVLLIESHHVASDVISRGVVFRELHALYREGVGGPPAALAPLRTGYADFAVWQRHELTGDRLEKRLAYWRTQLDGARALELPTDRRAAAHSPDGAIAARTFSPTLTEGLRRLNAAHGTTLFMTLLAGVDVLMSRYTQATDVVIGSPIAGRPHADLDGVVGYFVNTLVLRTSLDGDPSFQELLERVRATSLGAFEHQDVPYELMLTELAEGGRVGAGPLFNVMLSMLDGDARAAALEGTRVVPFAANRGAAKFDLLFAFREDSDGLRASIEYRSELFDHDTIDRMLGHLETLLTAAVDAPETPVTQLPLLTAAEREAQLVTWNATDAGWPTDATLHGLFEQQVARRRGDIAVQCDEVTLTYEELDRRANRLAWRLKAKGVGPDTLVAVCMEKSADLVAVLLGILKAGGAYVPMDPSYPDDRLSFMLADCEASIVVTEAALVPRLAVHAAAESLVAADAWADAPDARDEAPPAAATPANLCYVIYTSGSTGRPKGVLIEHRNVVRLLFNDHIQFEFSERDVWSVFHSFSFDFSVWEMYGALLYGGRLVVVPRLVAQDPAAYLDLLARERVTVLNQVPSAFYGLMREELARPSTTLGALRYIVFGGEALQPALLGEFHARYPATTLVNMFGITETTVHVTFKVIGDAEISNGASNIGGPIPTLTLYVLDDHLELSPVGITGELCVGGAGVARGYLKRPELTAERFVAHPFRRGERMYRSGDLGRLRANGEIEYLGRRDAQVKIRGFRIELGEIENVLAGHPGIRQAAIVAVDGRDGSQLVGYYVPADGGPPPATAELRGHLRERLPEYMVPAFLMPLESIPLTSNGKLDRKKLPAPQAGGESTSTYVAPRTTQEHQLVHLWKQLLDVRPIGIRDNFFDLGGHSLLAVRMLGEIEQISGRRLPLATLFEDATIERLAKRIETAVHTEGEPPMVVLPANADAKSFVFLHGDVRGGGWYCRGLSRLIGPDVRFLVLPTLRPTHEDDLATVESMAAHHVAELRKVQPNGPYWLGGFCFGGVVAFEMAQQLVAAGEQIDRLVLVDSALRNGPIVRFRRLIDAALPLDDTGRSVSRRAVWLTRVNAMRRMSSAERWEWLRRNIVTRLPGAKSTTTAPVTGAIPEGEIWRRPATDVIRFEARAAGAFVPGPSPVPIDLIVAIDKPEKLDLDHYATMGPEPSDGKARVGRRGWNFVSPDVRVHPVHASHVGLITDRLETFAKYLRECLDR